MHLKIIVPTLLGFFLFTGTAQAVSLRGSSQSLDKQARMARRLHLPLIKNVAQINRMLTNGQLRELPRQGETFYLDDQIGECDPMHAHLYRTASPAVVKFLSLFSREFYDKFDHHRLKVTSLTRTVEYQKMLKNPKSKCYNANAVAATRSAHITGAAIDISHKELTAGERRWMRNRLAKLKREHWLEPEEEQHQPCFHIMVFRA